MPIYDYLCSNCGQKTEFIHGIDAPAPRYCPACGAEGTLRKTFATPAVHFKGSGWAKKDRSSSSGSLSKAGSSSASSEPGEKKADSGSKDAPASGDKPSAKDTGSGSGASASSEG
jgi:putative FmdB family regulatory protein